MKLFDVHWHAVLHDLHRWHGLSLAARLVLLRELTMNGYVPAYAFGEHLEEIVGSGIPQYDATRSRLSVGNERRDLVKVLRAMHRHPLFDADAPGMLLRYIEEHFTASDLVLLASGGQHMRHGFADKHALSRLVSGDSWAGDLIAASTPALLTAWATERGLAGKPAGAGSVLATLRQLATRLVTRPHGVPLRDVVAIESRTGDLETFAAALHLGISSLVLFAGMRQSDLEPMIGLWPAAAAELSRPPAAAPQLVAVRESFTLALQMEDMTTVLAAAVAAPVRIRASDAAVFARAREELDARLATVPEWAAPIFSSSYMSRVDSAARQLIALEFATMQRQQGHLHLLSTKAGARWLALSPHDRLEEIVGAVRRSTQVNPRGVYDHDVRGLQFFPYTLQYLHPPATLRLRESLTRAFVGAFADATSGARGFLPIGAFLEHAAREANPFFALSSGSAAEVIRTMGAITSPRETFRTVWHHMLAEFLRMCLVEQGGATVGVHESGALCFALTDVGRYILGSTDHFTYGSDDVADVVIQPNFDVVFLGVAPSVEATLARFAQRVGVAPGLTLRITRASVLAAAESGMMLADVMGALERASSRPVPKNVQREIAGWMAAVRRATVRTLQVIECTDEETAERIVALLGAKVRRLAPTVFEVTGATPAARVALLKRLRAGGVFLEDGPSVDEAKPAAGRGRRRRV